MRLKGSNATKKLQHYNESAGKKRRLGSYSNRKVKAKVPCIMVLYAYIQRFELDHAVELTNPMSELGMQNMHSLALARKTEQRGQIYMHV